MNILSIIDKIYENGHFGTLLTVSIISLIALFIIVYILGVKDKKKQTQVKKEVEEEVKDITFDIPSEIDNIKEDVTFEMPSLTQNLENFKKSLEEEIQKEDMAEVRKTSGLILPKEKKITKILDLDKIEDTSILPAKEQKKIEEKIALDDDKGMEIPKLNENYEKHKRDLTEKLFNKEKKVEEVPIIKDGLKLTSEKTEIETLKKIEEKSIKNRKNDGNYLGEKESKQTYEIFENTSVEKNQGTYSDEDDF